MIASNLIELREARSLSRPQLARNARVARAHLWAVENRRNIPGIATLERISEALGVGLNRLFKKSDAEFFLEESFVRTLPGLLPPLNFQHNQFILETLKTAP